MISVSPPVSHDELHAVTNLFAVRREIMGLIPSNDHHHAPFPPQNPQTDRLVSCRILRGPLRSNHPVPIAVHTPAMADDDWGAAMLNGKTMVGVSRGGRIMVCTDWERALRSEDDFAAVTSLIECEPSTGADFDLGGWLSIHKTPAGKRILLEIKNRIYILRLDPQDLLDIKLPILVATTSSPSLGVPVSFMGVYDDCIMSTFTMVRPHMDIPDEDDVNEEGYPNLRVVPTKLIRVLTVAPEL